VTVEVRNRIVAGATVEVIGRRMRSTLHRLDDFTDTDGNRLTEATRTSGSACAFRDGGTLRSHPAGTLDRPGAPMTPPTIALKIDANTYVGTPTGYHGSRHPRPPRHQGHLLLHHGPDNTAKAIRRVITQRASSGPLHGWGPPRSTGCGPFSRASSSPAPHRRETCRHHPPDRCRGPRGRDHGWDHVKWHDLLPWIPKNMLALELGRACALFERCWPAREDRVRAGMAGIGRLPRNSGCHVSLLCQRLPGNHPLPAVIEGRQFATLQVPTTMPTLDELIVGREATRQNGAERLMARIRPGLNVHTIQAEIEGGKMAYCFEEFIKRLQGTGARFVTLGEAAEEAIGRIFPAAW